MKFIKGKSYRSLINVGGHRKQGNVYIAQETKSYMIYLSDLSNKNKEAPGGWRGESEWEEVMEEPIDTSFPEKWCIKGERSPVEWPAAGSGGREGLLPYNHWFYKMYWEGKRDTYFWNSKYYTSSNCFVKIPDNHTLVTKEQLINHYKLKNKQDELHKETKGHGITRSIRVNAVRKKIIPASSGGFTGSRITGGRKRTAVRSVKVSYNKVLT